MKPRQGTKLGGEGDGRGGDGREGAPEDAGRDHLAAEPSYPEGKFDGAALAEAVEAVVPADGDFDVTIVNGEPVAYRVDLYGRLVLADGANDFVEILSLPDEDGGGYAARLKADPENLCADGETVEGALAQLGARCAFFCREQRRWRQEAMRLARLTSRQAPPPGDPPQAPVQPQPQQVQWSYHRKSNDEVKKLARGVLDGTLHLSHGIEAIERDWPALVQGLRAQGINEVMHRAGVVAFFEEEAKASVLPGGARTFLTADTLDEMDYARLTICMDDMRRKPATSHSSWAGIWAKVAELALRVPARFLLAIRPRL